MNIYHWIAVILIADVLLVLFVRGADERRKEQRKGSIRQMEFEQ